MRTMIAALVMVAGIAAAQTNTPATTNAPAVCPTCKGRTPAAATSAKPGP